MEKSKNKQLVSKYYLIICVISIVSLLISNITSTKIFSLSKNITLPASALLFPITYIVGDIIAEVYGYKKAKRIIIFGFICNAFMVLFFALTIMLPAASTWNNQEAYKIILGTTPRMFVASLSAFLVGSLSNAWVMDFVKKLTKEKLLWARTISSTVVGEFLDTLIFATIAFYGTVPTSILISMILCQFVWKVGYEVIATPFTYVAINKYKKLENNCI